MSTVLRRVHLSNGSATTVEEWGRHGPAILFIHGIGSSRRDAARLGEALASTHRVYAYDQRGFGSAAVDSGSMLLTKLAEDACTVAAQITGDIVLIGHSWGGAIALIAGPRFAKQLMLIDPLLRVVPGAFHEYVDDLAPLLAIPPGPLRDEAVRNEFSDADRLDREAKVHALRTCEINDVARLGAENSVEDGGWDLREDLQRVRLPVTMLLAGQDSVVAPQDLANVPPTVTIQRFAKHGHTLHRSAFADYLSAVRELTQVEI